MSLRNRTNEFHSIVESHRQRGISAANGKVHKNPKIANASNFTSAAAVVARSINETAAKLEKLTKLVKKKTIFDDQPTEIQELTFSIKQEMAILNSEIAQLREYVTKQQVASNKQSNDHSNQIIVALQSRLANKSASFKDILEVRTQNMKAQKDRREQFSANTPFQTKQHNTSSALYRRGTIDNKNEKEDFVAIDMSSAMSMELTQRDTYAESRHEEIRNIEQTIGQLGSIFQQLATLIAEQGEQIQRIDDNVEDAEANIELAQKHLLDYFKNISSNRMLMIKIFGVLIVFFIDEIR